MGLSPEVIHQHVEFWQANLRSGDLRAAWPAHLFHAAHVSTAADILRRGELICRHDLRQVEHDVANQGALYNNPDAHAFVRLYFRPRTSFHLRTEGIKLRGDPHRLDRQMSIPIMFALDCGSVLSLPDVAFTGGMFSRKRPICTSDAEFASLDFSAIYHDAPVPERSQWKEIEDARMAEVLVPVHLPLSGHLRRIICRTKAEEATLLHLLGAAAEPYRRNITLENRFRSVFLHKYLYLKDISLRSGELTLHLHQPYPSSPASHHLVQIEQLIDGVAVTHWEDLVPAEWPRVTISPWDPVPGCVWRIYLEGELAFEAPLSTETTVLR